MHLKLRFSLADTKGMTINPSIRIGLSIATLTVSIILSADFFFNILPSEHGPLLEARKKFCESLAVQFTSLLENDQEQSLIKTMKDMVNRNPEVISTGIRLANGELYASAGDHDYHWDILDNELSTPTHARVPVFREGKEWGKIEIYFEPLTETGYKAVINSPLFRLIVVTLTLGFLAYTFFIKRTLRYLDPNAVVPGRVKTALDQLVEGVVLIDGSRRIVLANTAFAEMMAQPVNELIGKSISKMSWDTKSAVDQDLGYLPWDRRFDDSTKVSGVRLVLQSPVHGARVLSTNVSPIKDGGGSHRGLLVTFDDISEIEHKNRELKETISQLENAESKIRTQNDELRRLASVDPLSGAMNRRAFFEKLEIEFVLSKQEQLQLSTLMVDIDHFKKINDNYGHAVGDEVIKGMSRILIEHCHKDGAVGRYGGEEFCLVLPSMNTEQAMELANSIRVAFSNWSEESNSPTSGKTITASLGVSSMNDEADDAAKLVDQADQALYVSKTSGRNRVTSWFSIPKSETMAG